MSFPESEQQMKKIILFQEIELLDKDWLVSYPLVGALRISEVELNKRNGLLMLIAAAVLFK
jgi:hypothetical protein